MALAAARPGIVVTKKPAKPVAPYAGTSLSSLASVKKVPAKVSVPSGVVAGLAMPANATAAANPAMNPYITNSGVSPYAASNPTASNVGSQAVARNNVTAQSTASGYVPSTGFAAQQGYSPEMLDTIINQHPEILTRDVLDSLGRSNESYAGQLGQEGGVAQLVSFLMQSINGGSGSNNDTVNQMAQYFKNRVTPGGSTPDTQALVNAILGAGPNSKIYNELGLGAASGAGSSSSPQANANAESVNNMIYGVLNDQNRYTQQATQNYLAQNESNYIDKLAKGQTSAPDYLNYLKGNTNLANWF